MSLQNIFKQEKKTPQEIKATSDLRQNYYNYMNATTTNISTLVKSNNITPETSVDISNLISTDKKWLQSNPNADFETMQSKIQTLQNSIKDLMDTDKPKIQFLNVIRIYRFLFTSQKDKGQITDDMFNKYQKILDDEEKWFKTNSKTATELEFTNEKNDLDARLQDKGLSAKNAADANKISKEPEANVKKAIEEQEKKEEERNKLKNAFKDSSKIVINTALKVFFSFLLIVLLLLSASFSANLAISRPPVYRILYYIYGLIPFYAPFILFYTMYRRISKGPLPMYAILPVSLEAATTRIGKYLWYPFYWVPDQDSVNAYTEYTKQMETMVLRAVPVKLPK